MSRLPRLMAWSCLVVALVLAAGTGCGPKFAKVSGDVKFNGMPLYKGAIAFIPAERGKRGPVGVIENGKYSLNDVPLGDVLVTVVPIEKPEPEPLKGKPKKKDKKKKEEPKVATKYGDPKQTDLKFTVMPGENTFNIDLQPQPGP